MEEMRLIKPTALDLSRLEYAVPLGMKVAAVFDFNSFGVGMSVAFAATGSALTLAHAPSAEVWALCEQPTPKRTSPKTNQLSIDLDASGHGKVLVDGMDWSAHVSAFAFSGKTGSLTTATFSIAWARVTANVEAHIAVEVSKLPADLAAALYVALRKKFFPNDSPQH